MPHSQQSWKSAVSRFQPKFIIEIHININNKIDIDYFKEYFLSKDYTTELVEAKLSDETPLFFAQPRTKV